MTNIPPVRYPSCPPWLKLLRLLHDMQFRYKFNALILHNQIRMTQKTNFYQQKPLNGAAVKLQVYDR